MFNELHKRHFVFKLAHTAHALRKFVIFKRINIKRRLLIRVVCVYGGNNRLKLTFAHDCFILDFAHARIRANGANKRLRVFKWRKAPLARYRPAAAFIFAALSCAGIIHGFYQFFGMLYGYIDAQLFHILRRRFNRACVSELQRICKHVVNAAFYRVQVRMRSKKAYPISDEDIRRIIACDMF
ncbi:hypothetical protein SDC9_157070 [bioreactor metagenome]|uniref:Uncharacterized protein n=1 Tax=bioreactor metagenome TaxID=1076179 RepID=A0A645F5Z0_9ZZZZ